MPEDPSPKGARRTLRIGHYEVVSHIATGGMGAVYKAVDVDLGREVAIKVLPPDLASKPGMLERFRQEAQCAAKLRHENVVTIFEFGDNNGMLFLAMEYVDGIDLHQYIQRKGKLDPEEARFLLIQAVRALDQLHRQGMVHRDIKPSNFLITRKTGRPIVKLTDLGLAREVDDAQFKLTRSGTTVGTVDYMSPEQARDSRAADIRSDIYSLGCTFYHMLAGNPPFPEGGLTERLYKHVEVEPPDVRQFNPKVSEAVGAILRRMLEKDPAQRYQTPAELLKDLIQPKAVVDLSKREVLASLAELEESPRPRSETDPGRETKTTRTIVPPTTRIRDDERGLRRKRPQRPAQPSVQPLIVIQGWKAWAAVLATLGIAAAILVVVGLNWDKFKKQPQRQRQLPVAQLPADEPPLVQNDPPPAAEDAKPAEPPADAAVPPPPQLGPPPQPVAKASPQPQPAPVPEGPRMPPRPAYDGPPPVFRPPSQTYAELDREVESVRSTSTSADLSALSEMVEEFAARYARAPEPADKPLLELVRKFESQQHTSPEAKAQTLVEMRQAFEARHKKAPEPRLAVLIELAKEIETRQVTAARPPLASAAPKPAVGPAVLTPPALPGGVGTPPGKAPEPDAPPVPPAMLETRATAPHLIVSRSATEGDGRHFTTLERACAQAQADYETIIEIRDNGPLLEPALAVTGRSLVLRAGRGYRPLLAWDLQHPASAKAAHFLTVTRGNLTLENLDLVLRYRADERSELGGLVRVAGGDLAARSCSFSVSGKDVNAVSVLQLDAAPQGPERPRLQVSRCLLRGGDVTALAIRAPGADVLLDGCLVVNATRPLVDVLASNAPATHLRMVRSTLVSGQTLLRLRPATPADRAPDCSWLGWDTLLTRAAGMPGGEMVVVRDGASRKAMKWRAINCVYAGWQTLLSAESVTVSVADLPIWHELWQQQDGDQALAQPWPAVALADPSDTPPQAFQTRGTHVHFSATSGYGPLGCNVALVPPGRDNWVGLAYEAIAPALADQAPAGPPEIPPSFDGRYTGERIDSSKVPDLGQYLKQLEKKPRLAPRVVLHLVGSGEWKTSPIALKGVSLTLYFETTPAGAAPLTLVQNANTALDKPALIDIDGGGLEILGGAIRLYNFNRAAVPAYMLRVRGGPLRLQGCRLDGSLARAPDFYKGLIHFSGSSDPQPENALECQIAQSALVTGKTALHLAGTGTRLRLHNSIVVAGGDGLQLDLGPQARDRLNTQLVLERSTVAVKRAVLRLGDAPALGIPREPILLLARDSFFLDPFTATTPRAGLLAFEGDALARGLLLWRGEKNAFDPRLGYAAAPATATAPEAQPLLPACRRLWGPLGERDAVAGDCSYRTDLLDRPLLGRLTCTAAGRTKPEVPPGADLKQLTELPQLDLRTKPAPGAK